MVSNLGRAAGVVQQHKYWTFIELCHSLSVLVVYYTLLINVFFSVLRIRIRIRIRRTCMFLGLLDPDPEPLVTGMNPDPAPYPILISSSKNSRKNLGSYWLLTFFLLFIFEKWRKMNLNKVINRKNPDPLVRGMDPLIRIQTLTNLSWIRNTDFIKCCWIVFLF